MWNALRSPDGVQRGKKKQDRPFCAWARIRNASHIGPEQNHLCPVMRNSLDWPRRSARVVLARTSEPPCFSVIPIPTNTPDFSPAGRNRGSYFGERIRDSHCAVNSGSHRSAAIEEKVIETGHVWPNSFWASNMNSPARATLAPFLVSIHGRLWTWFSIAVRISSCQEG